MFLCMNSIYAPTFRQISTKLAMRQLKIQKFQASFQLAQLEFFTTNVSKFLCVRARNVSSILSTFAVLLQNLLVKFIYSQKATKFFEIFALLLSYVVPVKSKVEILQNFVAFSKYMNFIKLLKIHFGQKMFCWYFFTKKVIQQKGASCQHLKN